MDHYAVEDDRYAIWNHFLEPIAFYCMFQPSGLSDRMLEVAQNMLHQAAVGLDPKVPDKLDQDALAAGRFLKRRLAEKQLDRLGSRWTSYPAFVACWSNLNDAGYKLLTKNFRNRAAHSFAPRFELGHIARARRSVGPWQEWVSNPDGTCQLVEHSGKTAVAYVMGVIEPISFEAAHEANLVQYQSALKMMRAFSDLVEELFCAAACSHE